jgi:hypothetical protein
MFRSNLELVQILEENSESRRKPFVLKHLGLARPAGRDVSSYTTTLYINLTIL